jgi:hypothetical protein
MTKNQEAFNSFSPSGNIFSYDLSSATDRFPMEFQYEVMRKITCDEFADAWKRLMVGFDFYVPWDNSSVKYMVGQPMGAYTSWAKFALCHH